MDGVGDLAHATKAPSRSNGCLSQTIRSSLRSRRGIEGNKGSKFLTSKVVFAMAVRVLNSRLRLVLPPFESLQGFTPQSTLNQNQRLYIFSLSLFLSYTSYPSHPLHHCNLVDMFSRAGTKFTGKKAKATDSNQPLEVAARPVQIESEGKRKQ